MRSVYLIIVKGGIHFAGLLPNHQQFSCMEADQCILPALKVDKIAFHEPLMIGGCNERHIHQDNNPNVWGAPLLGGYRVANVLIVRQFYEHLVNAHAQGLRFLKY